MDIKKIITKYLVLLLVYIVLVRFIEPYALKLYYSMSDNPLGNPHTIQTLQSVMFLFTFVINLVFVIFMIIDIKSKNVLDWLIIIITFFSPEIGITIFIIWQIYKHLINKFETQI